MLLIYTICQKALITNQLTIEAEKELKWLLQNTKYDSQDTDAFFKLQEAVMEGVVKQESRYFISK